MSYKAELNRVLASSRQARQEAEEFLIMNGESVDLSEWLTAKEYADKYELGSTNVVTNWIRRGVIPPENVKTIKRLNGLRLIKAVAYRDVVEAPAV
jgi:uncharacterized protein YutE (UPF0331/DUF86 family)